MNMVSIYKSDRSFTSQVTSLLAAVWTHEIHTCRHTRLSKWGKHKFTQHKKGLNKCA